ncbi:MAG TPA: hypothetical protein VGF13_23270, partial [Verrucomicrobiae bacterium]
HYAAAVFQARLPRDLVATRRGARYSGKSKMNFVSLVIHGLQALSVFIEVVAVRLLIAMFLFAGFCVVLVLAASVAKLHLGLAIGLFVLALSLALGCFCLTLGFLNQRNNLDFIPIRDYKFFVEALYTLSTSDERTHVCGWRT